MELFGKRHDPVRLFFRRLGLIALLALVLVALSAVWDVYKKERDSRGKREDAEREVGELSQRQTKLQAEIAELRTVRGQEEAFREEYELGKDGEGLIIIIAKEEPAAPPEAGGFKKWLNNAFPWW